MEEQDYILFECYISGEMRQEDIVSFENRLKTDKVFNQSFQLYKETSAFLEYKMANEEKLAVFNKTLNQISEAHFNKVEGTRRKELVVKIPNFVKYAVAACIVMLLGFFVFNPSAPEYSDYANYGTVSLTVRGDNAPLLKTAETAFNNKDFKTANQALENLLDADKNNAELQFYRAVANIEMNDFKTSDALLDVLQKGTSVYKNKATWYLALSKLKQGKKADCAALIETIPADAEDYRKAQKLLKKL
ncbi:MAG: hypothetical protein ACK5MZ_05745 [Aestuariibaculum sp.]